MKSKRKEKFEKIFIWLIILILWIPYFQMITQIFPEKAIVEKRITTARPEFSFHSLGELHTYYLNYQTYFNDSFGFRGTLISINNYINLELLKNSSTDKVVIGKDGWLFYKKGLDTYCDYTNISDTELKMIANYLVDKEKIVEANGAQFYFIIGPDKHTIYQEKLLEKYKCEKETPMDRLIKILSEETDVNVVDVREELKEKPCGFDTYYKTDTHWNSFGAYIVYENLMKKVSLQYPSLPFIKAECTEVKSIPSGVNDLAEMLALENLYQDENIIISYITSPNIKEKIIDDNIFKGYRRVSYINNDLEEGKILVYRDSFSTALVPYFNETFHEGVYVWTGQITESDVKQVKPDIVVLEIVEREIKALRYYK